VSTAETKRPHFSFSSLDMHESCAECWRRRYICGEKIPPGIALLIGTGTDRGMQHNFSQKIESHVDLPAPDIVGAAVAGFEEAVARDGVELDADEKTIGQDKVLGQAKDLVASLANVHATDQAPDYQPVALQHPASIEFPSASHDLVGWIDMIDDRDIVTDFKTGAKRKNQKDVDNSLQLTIYAAAYRREFGSMPVAVQLDTLVKTKKPGRQLLTSTRSMADLEMMINRINVMLQSIQSGIFTPAPVGAWKCSPKFCGYWPTCKYVNTERKAAVDASGE
jgi:hypothetical protein